MYTFIFFLFDYYIVSRYYYYYYFNVIFQQSAFCSATKIFFYLYLQIISIYITYIGMLYYNIVYSLVIYINDKFNIRLRSSRIPTEKFRV